MRVDCVADIGRVGTHFDRQRNFRNEIAGIGPDDPSSEHPMTFCIEQNFCDAIAASE